MPSKRKKNKRRMRRVQAQRRALEEQHVANTPVKASPGIAASTPPVSTPKKAAKTPAPAPAKIPEAVPIAVPTVETPKVKPKPAVKEPVPVMAPGPEALVLEQISTEVKTDVPALVTEDAPGGESLSVAPLIVEAVNEADPIISVVEVTPTAEAPVAAPETEVQAVDTTAITSEPEQSHDICKTDVEVEALEEADTVSELDVEVSVKMDNPTPEPVTEASEEPEIEAVAFDQVSAEAEPDTANVVTEAAVESVKGVDTDTPDSEQVTKAAVSPASPAKEEEDQAEVEVLDEEDAPEGPAEVPDTITDAPVTEDKEAPVTLDVADKQVQDFVVTESASAVEATSDTFRTQTEDVAVTPAEPEPEPAGTPAGEIVIDAEQTGLGALSEEPKTEIADMPSQMQLVESVQLSSLESSVETALNGHIVPEVSIEG
ncbi:calphotin-like [Mastacembelus armatus]|uniref:calphotin-like n=1 Tax=Mastacembelus armatus TaxID=205130 RepID=UPI000E4623A9|nr:calphotin-like [Mastacembelus armatus]